jgi:hypothetical protein
MFSAVRVADSELFLLSINSRSKNWRTWSHDASVWSWHCMVINLVMGSFIRHSLSWEYGILNPRGITVLEVWTQHWGSCIQYVQLIQLDFAEASLQYCKARWIKVNPHYSCLAAKYWPTWTSLCITFGLDCLCGLVFIVSGYRSRGPGFDSQPYQIFWEVGCLERGPLSLVRIIE